MQLEFKAGDNKEYEVDGIWDNAVYAKESTTGQLPGLYYLALWKGYPKEENTWEPILAIQHLWRLVTAFHKNNPEQLIATSLPVDTASTMARPTQSRPARPTVALTKKRGQPAGPTTASTKKRGRLAGPTTAPTKKRGQFVRSTTTTKQAKKS